MDKQAFRGCTSLAAAVLPASLAVIGRFAFYDCSSLARVALPAGLASIGAGAFDGTALTRVTVPTTATIGMGAFARVAPACTTVLRLSPDSMRPRQLWYAAVDLVLAYKRCRPGLYGWLERANIRLGSYGPDGAARQRDREEFEADFADFALHAD